MRRNWYSWISCHEVPWLFSTAVTTPAAAGDGDAEVPEADAGEEHHRPAAGEEQDRGAEVGLLHHQRHRHQDQQERQDHPEDARDLRRVEPVVVGRQHHHERDLHHLRRLELDRPEVDPALRAHADEAHDVDGDEQQQRDQVGHRRHQPPEADVDHGDRHHADEPDAEADHLRLGPGLERAAGHREEHQEAGAGHGGQQQDQRPVEREELRRARAGRRCVRWRRGGSCPVPRRPRRPGLPPPGRASPRAAPRSPCAGRADRPRAAAARRRARRAGCRGRSAPPPPSRRRRARRSARRRTSGCRRARSRRRARGRAASRAAARSW